MATGWYPVIDAETCINDNQCADFCTHEVFAKSDEYPLVVNPDNCVEFCRGCAKICPVEAIGYFGDSE